MITDCNLYSQTYVLEKKKIIFINGYQLKRALHVSHLFLLYSYLNITYKWLSHFDDSGRQNNIQHQCIDRLVNFCTIMQSNNSQKYYVCKDIIVLYWISTYEVGCRELKCQIEKREPIHEVL